MATHFLSMVPNASAHAITCVVNGVHTETDRFAHVAKWFVVKWFAVGVPALRKGG